MSPPRLRPRRAVHRRDNTPASVALLLWDLECLALKFSYERWIGAEDPERAAAYDAYQSTLDREHNAAEHYARELGGHQAGRYRP